MTTQLVFSLSSSVGRENEWPLSRLEVWLVDIVRESNCRKRLERFEMSFQINENDLLN
jgi:hypothetical protein